MTDLSNPKQYFNLRTTGIGAVMRPRMVNVPSQGGRRADPFLACTIQALIGPRGDAQPRYIDVRVVGEAAQTYVSAFLNADAESPSLVKFHIGDLRADAYIRPKGEHAGEIGGALKGRLVSVTPLDESELEQITHFDLATQGIGFLNQVKRVTQGETAIWTAKLAAMVGEVGSKEYRHFDTRIATRDAVLLTRRCLTHLEVRQRVQVSFVLHDMHVDTFRETEGEFAGKPMGKLRADLVRLTTIKIAGKEVYRDPSLPSKTDAPATPRGITSQADEVQTATRAAPVASAQPVGVAGAGQATPPEQVGSVAPAGAESSHPQVEPALTL
ncbi:DUF3577 domain-containing protein [Delftia lacustris]|uniref:DUF3577 domain-containing protein n=1 Tax=Delftia lacustris TaxID=558537 RepID=UPI00193B5DBC|nr:DUF3577 domain-containing protein [Delftia lacustris]QRI92966.1 DUF3577 domain-containing protein [Delftia lacustris]